MANDETQTIPDDLVQNWPDDIQGLLVTEITQLLADSPYLKGIEAIECSDIVVCGSRVLGGFRPGSDIDTVAYVKNYVPPQLPGRAYFRHRVTMQFLDVKADVWLRCPDDISLGIFPGHPDAPTELGWRLPYYSLLTKQVAQILPEEIEGYLRFMYPMKPSISSGDRRWDKLITDIKLPF